jgi:hypothetical protein
LFATVVRVFRRLDASIGASGPHDFAVRVSTVRHAVLAASTASRPTSVTIAKRPSVWDGMIRPIPVSTKQGSEKFLQTGLDSPNQLDLTLKFRFFAR